MIKKLWRKFWGGPEKKRYFLYCKDYGAVRSLAKKLIEVERPDMVVELEKAEWEQFVNPQNFRMLEM